MDEIDSSPVEVALLALEPKPPITFDPDGNLTFLVGPTLRLFRVCSRTVSRSSPVFQRMLNGPWVESKPGNSQDWIVELPEDDEEALALVLHITHGQFDLIKPALEVEELFRLCVVVNKYNLVHMLRPWASGWCAAIEAISREETDADDRLLWIAWVLGHEAMFRRAANGVLAHLEIAPSENGSEGEPVLITDRSHIDLEHEFISSIGVLDEIATARINIIKTFLFLPEALMGDLMNTLAPANPTCGRNSTGAETSFVSTEAIAECRCFNLGALIRALRHRDLFPLPTPETFTQSLSKTAESFRSIVFESMADPVKRDAHFFCNLNSQFGMIDNIKLTFDPPSKYIDHLHNQRQKSGLPEPGTET